jgi:uncharacterized protein YecT (DUF1311 family)
MQNMWWAPIIAIGFATAAHAQVDRAVDARLSRHYWRCMKGNDDPVRIAACNWGELQRQQQRLNKVYRRALRHLEIPAQLALRDQQREWIRRRDDNCSEQTDRYAGPLQQANLAACQLQDTVRRTIELDVVGRRDSD